MASDAELISWSLAGDDMAFVEMIQRHKAAVWAYLVRRAGRSSAEDLLSEVWLAAFDSRSSYDRSYPEARPWLFGIAHNTLRRHWRSQPSEDTVADVADLSANSDPWPAVDERIDGVAVLREALEHLAPNERDVLLLMVWEELSIADAARSLDMPAGSARRCLHQARLALRAAPGMVALLTQLNTVKETK
ncbi:MAG: RNA polymerase sigma factor [Acidimicrobiales bacterium]